MSITWLCPSWLCSSEVLCCAAVNMGCLMCKGCGGAGSHVAAAVCSKEQRAKAIYAALFILSSITAWVFSVWAGDILQWVPAIHDVSACCQGPIAVYRLTWALALFHLTLALLVVGVKDRGEGRAIIHSDWYSLKLLFFALLLAAAFSLPTSFFFTYGEVALFGAAVFIVLQLLMLVDFAHTLNEGWVGGYELSGDRKYMVYLAVSTFLCYSVLLVLSVLMYVYHMGPQTWTSPFFITLNIVLCLCITLASVHPAIQKIERSTPVGLFQAAFVSSYSTYLVFSGLMDNTESSALQTTTLVMGSVFIILCVGYTAIRISGHEDTYLGNSTDSASVNLMIEDEDEDGEGEEKKKKKEKEAAEEKEESGPVSYSYSFFHLVFCFGACYVCMLLTSWATISGDEKGTIRVDSGQMSMWVKMITSWIVMALYLWTLIAPMVLPNRQW